eukprot:3656600-Rhodomonas_salina.2
MHGTNWTESVVACYAMSGTALLYPYSPSVGTDLSRYCGSIWPYGTRSTDLVCVAVPVHYGIVPAVKPVTNSLVIHTHTSALVPKWAATASVETLAIESCVAENPERLSPYARSTHCPILT